NGARARGTPGRGSLGRGELRDGRDLLDEHAAAEEVRRLLPDLGGQDVPRLERVLVEGGATGDGVSRPPKRVGGLDVAVREPNLEHDRVRHGEILADSRICPVWTERRWPDEPVAASAGQAAVQPR